MQVKKGTYRYLGSCNFCRRGELCNDGHNIKYPYNEVYEIEGTGIRIRMCEDCIEKIKNIDDLVIATKVMNELEAIIKNAE